MRVGITGATGFIGSHTTKAALERGHEVRLLVRNRAKVPGALAPHGVEVPDAWVIEGDVTDEASVKAFLADCDAVVHAAAIYSLDPAREAEIAATNLASTRLVLDAAVAANLDPIVHVSSFVALLPGPRRPIGNEVDVGTPEGAYCISKADSERVARELQAAGHPVVIVWPGAVMGPHDPYLGNSNQMVVTWLGAGRPQWSAGRIPINDVRDVAETVAACLHPGRGPRRYFAVDGSVGHQDIPTLMSEAAGRPVRLLVFPAGLVRFTARWFGVPPNEEGAYIAQCSFEPDARATTEELGVQFRSKVDTLRDTARWLVEAGHVPPTAISS